ncbi:uncharacterized protein LOC113790792 [Dermatophagoides pteronyssinus]|uniref:uncharacterized protein LOC113790792 n=1 Tax=Dermatophagoides pteronyssinus TaxID=6956 RepID=UPI003F680045
MSEKKNIFSSSIYESAYKELKEIEEIERTGFLQSKGAKCPNCSWIGRTRKALAYHVQTKHKTDYNALKGGSQLPVDSPIQIMDHQNNHDIVNFEFSSDMVNFSTDVSSTFIDKIMGFGPELSSKALSMFDKIVELRYTENVPESTFSRIISTILDNFSLQFCDKKDENTGKIMTLIQHFASDVYLQKMYVKYSCKVIEPIPTKISATFIIQRISLKEIVSFVLSDKSLLTEICKEQNQKYYRHSYNSELSCSYERWKRINGKLRIVLYSDEFGIANPIGHSASKHNYLVVYCTFENIPLKNRLKRDDIFLLLIANHKDVNPELLDKILSDLAEELSDLIENGFQKNFDDGKTLNVPCTLSALVGDSKTTYQFTGYSGSFGLSYRCRMCGADNATIQLGQMNRKMFGSESDLKEYWKLVENASGIDLPYCGERDWFGLTRTFKFGSQANQINPWNCVPVDICHDLLEGTSFDRILTLFLNELNNQFVRNKEKIIKTITGYQFNDTPFIINSVSGGFSFTGDMIQVAEFIVRIEEIILFKFPRVINVDAETIFNSNAFKLYSHFKKICIISFQLSISLEDIQCLKKSIDALFQLIYRISPSTKITPKMHHITHYPALIEYFGPLIKYSTLPFERKHQFFKKWSRIISNHKNPSSSLAIRHQYHQAIINKKMCHLSNHTNSSGVKAKIMDFISSGAIKIKKNIYQTNKKIIKQINENTVPSALLWMEATTFWKVNENVVVQGSIYERTEGTVFSFQVLKKNFIANLSI